MRTPMNQSRRDVYFDSVRAVAIVRVVLYHVSYTGWLAVLFPSMGIMFALGGRFAAASNRQRGLTTIHRRLARVLPAFWMLAIVLVPLNLVVGYLTQATSDISFWSAINWIFPLTD